MVSAMGFGCIVRIEYNFIDLGRAQMLRIQVFFRKLCLTLRKAREYLQNVPTRGLMIISLVLFAPNGCSEGLRDLSGRTAGNV